jgi:surfeit locus 1 family protein
LRASFGPPSSPSWLAQPSFPWACGIRGAEARNFFTPDDNPALGLYYTSAPDVIAKQLGLVSNAPFIIDADASPVPGGWPKGGTAVIALPNNHLADALTWFGLALALFYVFAAYAWQNRRRIA